MIGALAQTMENQCWQTTLEIHVLTYTSDSNVLQGLYVCTVAKPDEYDSSPENRNCYLSRGIIVA